MSSVGHNIIDNNMQYESRVRDFIALLKPRVMSLVVFTGAIGLLVAPGNIDPFLAFIAIFCIALASGASGAINMWYDADIDSIMSRTKSRPIPSGKVAANEALAFGVIAASFSVLLMWMATNIMAAIILTSAILFYVFVYTMYLKRRTPQNIVIGGAAGSFPPMIGWAAVTGDITINSILLFLIIFMWTPPHFWALALYKSDDYEMANVPMLPVVEGEDSTKKHIIIYTLICAVTSILPYFTSMFSYIYLTGAITLNILFIRHSIKVYNTHDNKENNRNARRMFFFSILYLFILFALMVLDKFIL